MIPRAVSLLSALLSGAVLAQPQPQPQTQPQSQPQAPALVTTAHARGLAATCATCHIRGGAGNLAIPPLDGRPAAETAETLRAYKSGARAGTVMPQLARGYGDADLDAIAQWYAAHP